MSLPSSLPQISTASTAWNSDYEYRHKSSVTGYEIYDLWKVSHSNWFNVAAGFPNPDAYSIKVDTSSGVWSDNAPTTTPSVDASNSTYVILNNSTGDELFRFTKPSYFSSSSGGGTSTEEVAVLAGSWSTLADGTLAYTIGSSSPTSSTANGLYDIRYTLTDGSTGRIFQPGSINHTNGTATTAYLGSSTLDGFYELIHIGSSLNSFPITVLASLNIGIVSRKKVHSNFW